MNSLSADGSESNGSLGTISEVVELCLRNAAVLESNADGQPFEPSEKPLPLSVETYPWRSSEGLLREPIPEVTYLLDGLVPETSVILLSGREGSMKSWLVMEWTKAISEGRGWQGRSCAGKPGLYIDAEMPFNVSMARLQAIGACPNFNVWHWQHGNFPLTLHDQRLFLAAKNHGVIVLDTLKRFMNGLDENSATDMAEVTGGLRLLTKWGATVIACHHSPKNQTTPGYRGSTELGAGVDIALNIERIAGESSELIRIAPSKTRYSHDPRLVLRVTRTPTKPLFEDVTNKSATSTNQITQKPLEELSELITTLKVELGRAPNQTEIAERAKVKGLASRNTIIAHLKEGEEVHWRSNSDGAARVYEPIV